MEKPAFDPGLTQKYTGALRRTINKDGTFNVHRRGAILTAMPFVDKTGYGNPLLHERFE